MEECKKNKTNTVWLLLYNDHNIQRLIKFTENLITKSLIKWYVIECNLNRLSHSFFICKLALFPYQTHILIKKQILISELNQRIVKYRKWVCYGQYNKFIN